MNLVVEQYGRFYPAKRVTSFFGMVESIEFFKDPDGYSCDYYSGSEGYSDISFPTQQQAFDFFPVGTAVQFVKIPERETHEMGLVC